MLISTSVVIVIVYPELYVYTNEFICIRCILTLLVCLCVNIYILYVCVCVQKIAKMGNVLHTLEESMIHKLRDDSVCWFRILTIVSNLLEHTRKTLKHPGLFGLLKETILPAAAHQRPFIRNGGLHCLALFCLFSRELAREYMHLFLQVIENDHEVLLLSLSVSFSLSLSLTLFHLIQALWFFITVTQSFPPSFCLSLSLYAYV